MEVPATATPLMADTAAFALGEAARVASVPLTRAGALLLLALVWVETARGKAVIQHNVGNLLARSIADGSEKSVWNGDYWRPPWFADTAHRLHQTMLDGGAPSAFRAYDTLVEGMRDYFALLLKKPTLIAAANTGNETEFVEQLSKLWSPNYNQSHVRTFKLLVSEFTKEGLFEDYPMTDNLPSVAVRVQSPEGKTLGTASVTDATAPGVITLSELYGAPVLIAYPNGWRLLQFAEGIQLPAVQNLPYAALPEAAAAPSFGWDQGAFVLAIAGLTATIFFGTLSIAPRRKTRVRAAH